MVWLFLELVDRSEVFDYYVVIKDFMGKCFVYLVFILFNKLDFIILYN